MTGLRDRSMSGRLACGNLMSGLSAKVVLVVGVVAFTACTSNPRKDSAAGPEAISVCGAGVNHTLAAELDAAWKANGGRATAKFMDSVNASFLTHSDQSGEAYKLYVQCVLEIDKRSRADHAQETTRARLEQDRSLVQRRLSEAVPSRKRFADVQREYDLRPRFETKEGAIATLRQFNDYVHAVDEMVDDSAIYVLVKDYGDEGLRQSYESSVNAVSQAVTETNAFLLDLINSDGPGSDAGRQKATDTYESHWNDVVRAQSAYLGFVMGLSPRQLVRSVD